MLRGVITSKQRRTLISSCLVRPLLSVSYFIYPAPVSLPIQPSSSAQPLGCPYLSTLQIQARREDDADILGKVAEGKQYHKAQGKYSLEGALLLKTHAAQQKLKEKEKGVDPLAG
jgi:hypothetical protein